MAETPRAGGGGGDAKVDDVTARMEKMNTSKTASPSKFPPLHHVDTNGCRFVYFDLKTTGFDENSNVIQIAACSEDRNFFVLPRTIISQESLQQFINYLDGNKQVVLFGHNALRFDCPRLLKSLKEHSLDDGFGKNVRGFVDTYMLFSRKKTDAPSNKLKDLYTHYTNNSFPPHDAREDIQALERIVPMAKFTTDEYYESSFTFEDVIQHQRIREATKQKQQEENLGEKEKKVIATTIWKGTATEPFESDLSWKDALQTFMDDGEDALREKLREELLKMASQIINNICEHLQPE